MNQEIDTMMKIYTYTKVWIVSQKLLFLWLSG